MDLMLRNNSVISLLILFLLLLLLSLASLLLLLLFYLFMFILKPLILLIYSQNCLKGSPKGRTKSGCSRQVTP